MKFGVTNSRSSQLPHTSSSQDGVSVLLGLNIGVCASELRLLVRRTECVCVVCVCVCLNGRMDVLCVYEWRAEYYGVSV